MSKPTKRIRTHYTQVTVQADINLSDIDEDDLIEYLESAGFTVFKGSGKVTPIASLPAPLTIADVSLYEVIADAYQKHGYALTELIRQLL